MSDLDCMKQDTIDFLEEWGESMTRKRQSTTYDGEGKAVTDWDLNDLVFAGDWQPLSGSDIRAESGRTDKSDAKIFVVFDQDIEADDRIVRGQDTWDVNYSRNHEDHRFIFIRKLRHGG